MGKKRDIYWRIIVVAIVEFVALRLYLNGRNPKVKTAETGEDGFSFEMEWKLGRLNVLGVYDFRMYKLRGDYFN